MRRGVRGLVVATVLTALSIVSLLSGCADRRTDPGGPPSSLPSPSVQNPTTPSLTPPSTPTGVQQISGTVTAGVEAGCLLLGSEVGDAWLLIGKTGSIKVGDRVTVEGRPDPGAMTTCQQGKPFQVEKVL